VKLRPHRRRCCRCQGDTERFRPVPVLPVAAQDGLSDQLSTWAQFHQRSMYRFYVLRSRKCKKDSQVVNLC